MNAQLTPAQIEELKAKARQMLPSNATAYERALVAGMLASALPAPIADLWDPVRCPLPLLPYLAWAFSVDVWDEGWPEHKKRSTVARAFDLHRLKGTLAGLEAFADLAGGEVLRAVVPPGKFFLSAGLGDAERRSLLERMPQIRIYKEPLRAPVGPRLFFSLGAVRSGIGRRCLANGGAAIRALPRIVWAEKGNERPITVEEIAMTVPGIGRALVERALVRRRRWPGVTYLGGPLRGLATTDSDKRIATFMRIAGAPSFISYGLRPVSIDPERASLPGRKRKAFFLGDIPRGRFFADAYPEARVFERIVIWDPDYVPQRRGASFLGVSRFGMPAFSADLTVSIAGSRRRKAFGMRGYVGGFLCASSRDRYDAVLRALRSAKAARDQIQVNTTTYRSPLAGNLIIAGTPFIAGRLLRS